MEAFRPPVEMDHIDYMVPGDLVLERDTRFTSMVAGSLTVKPGVRAEITGMVAGNLVVEAGAQVIFTGMVAGDLVNRGGDVSGAGLVAGRRLSTEAAA